MAGRYPKLETSGKIIPLREDQADIEAAARVRGACPEAPWEIREDEIAGQVWDEYAPIAHEEGRLEPLYVPMFAAFCVNWAVFLRCAVTLARPADEGGGLTYRTGAGRNGDQEKVRPLWRVQQEALTAARQASALFGMSPVDAKRLEDAGQSGNQADFFEALNASLHRRREVS